MSSRQKRTATDHDVIRHEGNSKRSHVDQRQHKDAQDDDDDQPPEITVWTEQVHRAFVEAIYEVGLKHASPSVIMEKMTMQHEAITSERVKSHLQKYRNNKVKSRVEFLNEYENWMQKALTVGAASGTNGKLAPPDAILSVMGSDESLIGGDVAAFLSYAVMFEDQKLIQGSSPASTVLPSTPDFVRAGSNEYTKYFSGTRIPFPILTEEERKSPLGVSISHVVGLFSSMTQHLLQQRHARGDMDHGGGDHGGGAVDVAGGPETPEPIDDVATSNTVYSDSPDYDKSTPYPYSSGSERLNYYQYMGGGHEKMPYYPSSGVDGKLPYAPDGKVYPMTYFANAGHQYSFHHQHQAFEGMPPGFDQNQYNY